MEIQRSSFDLFKSLPGRYQPGKQQPHRDLRLVELSALQLLEDDQANIPGVISLFTTNLQLHF